MTSVPELDASGLDGIGAAGAAAYRTAGALVLRNLLAPDELAALRAETLALVERASAGRVGDPDFQYKRSADGAEVPFRIEYVIDKSPACRALLAHPFVLRSVERLQGPDFVPTWDSMVWKQPGAGAAIEWHRDAESDQCDGTRPIFNVDFYLDASDAENGLFAIPGSQRWSDAEARAACDARNADGTFRRDGAVAIPLRPGDALLHDILLVHGSPPARSALRRVIYYEFRPADVERRLGPHTESYLPAKRRVLLACLRDRAARRPAEAPFAACWPDPPAAPEPAPLRVPHHEHWRWDLERERQARRAARGESPAT
jgi:ectoine hydroxylase-related dioxygenase (phytanoyl-CoA dioxygenase family)